MIAALGTIWTFLKSPVGLGLSAFVALMIYVQIQRSDAASSAAAECNAGVYKAQVDQLTKDLADANRLAEQQKLRADNTETQKEWLEKTRDDLLKQLANMPDNSRKLPPAVRKRMLDIR